MSGPASRLQFPVDSCGIIDCKACLARPGRVCGTHQKLCGSYQDSEVCHSMLCCSSAQVLWKMQTHQECPPRRITPLESTLTKNAPVSSLECTVTKSLDLKCPGMNTYKKRGVGACGYTVAKRPNGHLMYEACAPERELALFQGASVPEPRGSGLGRHSGG